MIGGKCDSGDKVRIMDKIWTFDTKEFEWSVMNVRLPEASYGFGIIKYNFDKYIILFGGMRYVEPRRSYYYSAAGNRNLYTQEIIIFDVDRMTFIIGSVKSIFKGIPKAIKSSNYFIISCLVCGYVRDLYERWPGQEMIDLIIAHHGLIEYAHLFGNEGDEAGKHERIDLRLMIDHSLLSNDIREILGKY